MKKSMNLSMALLCDLRLDRVLSEQALAVLASPFGDEARRARQECFTALEDAERLAQAESCREALILLQRAVELGRNVAAMTVIDRAYAMRRMMDRYLNACERLAELSYCGTYFATAAHDVAVKREILLSMEEAGSRLAAVLERLRSCLLSVADKTWLTPDGAHTVSERERISDCGVRLGLIPPFAAERRISPDHTLTDAICRLHTDEVTQMEEICSAYAFFPWDEPLAYLPELKFVLEISGLVARAAAQGIPHCTPTMSQTPQYTAREMYDISLLAKACEHIVPNDVSFTEDEPFHFLTGANGGGKTTYLRAVGLNLVLACAGCPVFARQVTVYPFAWIAAHMPRDERFDRTGRLDEERARVEQMLDAPSGDPAFLLFNETFSGTDDARGFSLLAETVKMITEAGHFGLYVTHFHEVTELGVPLLSAQIDPMDENRRTYRIVRTGSDASSYAADILRKYRLDSDSLRERRRSCER